MLEVCVDSYESAEVAINAGAFRIELCSALREGGLTPTVGLLKTVKSKFPDCTVFAMLRPHSKISYRMSDTDFEIVLADMKALKDEGADGFVFGALTADREIDVEICRKVIDAAGDYPVTFHRAFDITPQSKWLENVELIAGLGFTRILSSGYCRSVEKGINTLSDIRDHIVQNGLNVKLVPGGGITVENAEEILQMTGCSEFHATGKTRVSENIPRIKSNDGTTLDLIDLDEINVYFTADRETLNKLVGIGQRSIQNKGF